MNNPRDIEEKTDVNSNHNDLIHQLEQLQRVHARQLPPKQDDGKFPRRTAYVAINFNNQNWRSFASVDQKRALDTLHRLMRQATTSTSGSTQVPRPLTADEVMRGFTEALSIDIFARPKISLDLIRNQINQFLGLRRVQTNERNFLWLERTEALNTVINDPFETSILKGQTTDLIKKTWSLAGYLEQEFDKQDFKATIAQDLSESCIYENQTGLNQLMTKLYSSYLMMLNFLLQSQLKKSLETLKLV